jgi:hypothetical protein
VKHRCTSGTPREHEILERTDFLHQGVDLLAEALHMRLFEGGKRPVLFLLLGGREIGTQVEQLVLDSPQDLQDTWRG